MIAPSGGKEPGRVPVGCPVGSEQSEGIFGQGDIAVFGALTTVDMDLIELLPRLLWGTASLLGALSTEAERSQITPEELALLADQLGWALWLLERWEGTKHPDTPQAPQPQVVRLR